LRSEIWSNNGRHSHWSKIKRAGRANDAKRRSGARSPARSSSLPARAGDQDNLNLRYIIDEARAVNMPRTRSKSHRQGTGELGGEQFEMWFMRVMARRAWRLSSKD
jgi:transcriptional/translational regulatory protein YebC/TACO1